MSLKIIKAGILDTIQNAERNGFRHLGINPSGAMDRFSAQLANALMGKDLHAPLIEMHFPASSFLFEQSTVACITGADFSATVNDAALPLFQPFFITANSILKFNNPKNGAHAYLSLLHDLGTDEWLYSASTNLKLGVGGWQGRKLQKDDAIPFKQQISFGLTTKDPVTVLHWKAAPMKTEGYLACLKGNEWNWLTTESQEAFETTAFHLSNLSDRMGYRVYGEHLKLETTEQLISSAVDFGTIQLLPNGQLIILMADHQTTGGYPRIAHVTSTTLNYLAQLKPHDEINFHFISLEEAEENLIEQQKYLQQLQNACKLKIEKLLHAPL